MEKERKEKIMRDKIKTIDDSSDIKNVGTSFISSFLDSLKIELPINMLNYGRRVNYKLFDVMKFLIASQIYDPSSKLNAYINLKDKFLFSSDFSYPNLLDALDVFGEDYQSIIELFNNCFKKLYKFATDKVFSIVQTIILKLINLTMINKKVQAKKTEKIQSLEWAFF